MGEGFSQTEFAAQLGISKQRLYDLEGDRFQASLGLAKSLAKKLDLPEEWLAKLVLDAQIKKEGLRLKFIDD